MKVLQVRLYFSAIITELLRYCLAPAEHLASVVSRKVLKRNSDEIEIENQLFMTLSLYTYVKYLSLESVLGVKDLLVLPISVQK